MEEGKNPFGKWFSYAGRFKNGQAVIKEKGKWGMIDKSGKYILKPSYGGVTGINDSRAWVMERGVWHMIYLPDKSSMTEVPLRIIGRMNGGSGWVEKMEEEKEGVQRAFMNEDGKIFTPWYSNATDFYGGWARFEEKGKWGFIDRKGKVVILPKYGYVDDFREGLAAYTSFMDDEIGKYGYINKGGEEVIPMSFNYARSFKGGDGGSKE